MGEPRGWGVESYCSIFGKDAVEEVWATGFFFPRCIVKKMCVDMCARMRGGGRFDVFLTCFLSVCVEVYM